MGRTGLRGTGWGGGGGGGRSLGIRSEDLVSFPGRPVFDCLQFLQQSKTEW